MTEPSPEQPAPTRRPKRPSRWQIALFVVGVLAGGIVAAVYYRHREAKVVDDRPSESKTADAPFLQADARQLKSTLVSPHLEAPIAPGKNVLWCSTFQLAWNELCRAAGGDLHLENEPPMVAVLNKKAASQQDVDAASCVVMYGQVKDGIVGKIRQELDRKFSGQASPDLLDKTAAYLPPDGWLAYAYLFRSLPFKYRFDRLTRPLAFGAANVASFGLEFIGLGREDELIAGQVSVLDHKNDDDFIVELKPEVIGERIVLAKIVPAQTFQGTIDAVRTRIASARLDEWGRRLHFGESFVVPILDFDVSSTYDELCNKPILTPGPLKGLPILAELQDIRFRLDERGAVLKSEALGAVKAGPPPKPRRLIFDKPFLILLECRGAAQPYFALWVDNAEILVPFD